MQTLGELLKQTLDARGLSLREASKLVCVSHNHLNNIIHGVDSRTKRPFVPSFDILKKLSHGLNLPYWQLLSLAGGLPNGYDPAILTIIDQNRDLAALMTNPDDTKVLLEAATAILVYRRSQSTK